MARNKMRRSGIKDETDGGAVTNKLDFVEAKC